MSDFDRMTPAPIAGVATAPVRDANGRFVAGNAGRRKGSRNRAAGRLAAALLDDFTANEGETIERLRRWYFPQYVQLMGRFVPRETGALRPDFADYSAEETARVTAAARAALERVERGEDGLDALLAVLERDPAEGGVEAAETAPATVNYGESTVETVAAAVDDTPATGWPLRRNY